MKHKQKIGVQKTKGQNVVSSSTKEEKVTPLHFHYGMTQHFTITIQESDLEDEFEQMTRMFHVIISNPKILEAICEFEVLSAMEDTYVSESYGDMNYYIGDILAQFLDCFIEEDQHYIRQWEHDYGAFSRLGDCFKLKPDGFHVDEYNG